MLLSILYFLVIAKVTCSLPWNGPQQTDSARAAKTADWSPVPTSDGTEDIPFHQLVYRDLYPISVCGWIAGRPQVQALCSTGSSCVWNSDYKIVGCCATASDECKFYTSCLDLNSPDPIGNRDDVFTCKGTSECYSNEYPNGYSQWGCGKSAWATSVWTAFPGMGTRSLQMVTMGIADEITVPRLSMSSSSSSLNTNMTSASTSSDFAHSQTSASAKSGSPSNGNINTGKPLNKATAPVGPIAGGVIAGIALLSGLVGIGLFGRRHGWLRRRQSNGQVNSIPQDMLSPPPMEGTVNLDSNPIFELDGSPDIKSVSPVIKYDDAASIGKLYVRDFGRDKRNTQISEISRLSELPSFKGII